MSQENVEVVRHLFDAFARGDVEAILRLQHPDAIWAPLIAPMIGVEEIRGQEAFRRFLTQDLLDGFDAFTLEPLSFQHHGDNVIVAVHLTGQIKASGLQIDDISAFVWTLREGKVAAVREYDTEAEALEAVGLRE
jgi:ketosteroid isomerase-like protein